MTKKKTKPTATVHQLESAEIRTFPLSRLRISPLNPRQDVPAEQIEALAQSIELVGLLQNLVGTIEGEAVDIAGGGRRLRSLNRLAELGKIDPDSYEVPVRIAPDNATAREWAIAENVARVSVNPADEVEAFKRHIEEGAQIETVAKAFAVTTNHVKGRLRLAALAPPILEALRAGEITLDVAKAFTVSKDQQRQLTVYGRYQNQHWFGADGIKRSLTEELLRESDPLVCFVTREAYEAAGGRLRIDLFGEDVWFENRDLLEKLAQEKLDGLAADFTAAGWSWVSAQIEDPGYEGLRDFQRTYGEPVEFSDAEEDRYYELDELIDDDEATDEQKAEYEALAERKNQEVWTDTQRKHAGAIITIGYRGEVKVTPGLIRKEDQEAAKKAGLIRRVQAGTTKPSKEDRGPFSGALLDDMKGIRTAAVQHALLDKPQLALDLLIYALGEGDLIVGSGLGIRAYPTPCTVSDVGPFELDKRLRPGPVKCRTRKEYASAFRDFLDLSRKDKNARLATIVSRCVAGSLSAQDPIFDMLADLAGAKPRLVWTPNAAFFGRMTRDALTEVCKALEPANAGSFATWKKRDQVSFLDKLFTDPAARKQQSADVLARVDAWTPAEMKSPAEGAATAPKAPKAKAA